MVEEKEEKRSRAEKRREERRVVERRGVATIFFARRSLILELTVCGEGQGLRLYTAE